MSTQISATPSEENLTHLLNPKSLAIVGVSRNPDSFGYPLVEIIQRCGYTGQLYLVNPKADEILGLKCHPSILDIPGEVDVAMIMVGQRFAAQAVRECVDKKVKGIVMITAGFAEQGDEGRKQQDDLVRLAQERGIRILGPNTLGYYSAPARLDAIMSGFIKAGNTALMTQSGNMSQSLTFPGAQRGLGYRYVVAMGNQADIQAHDLIRNFRKDPDTRAIAIHIEGLLDGQRFMQEVRETVASKPVLVVKSGRTEKGAQVASSHTAAIAGNDSVYAAAFRQCGAIQLESLSAMTSALLAIDQGKPMKGKRVCIVSEGGGDCSWTSDACIRNGLEVPELSAHSQQRLKEFIPSNGSTANPIDLAGWEGFVDAVEIALEDDQIDGIILVGGFAGNFHINPRDYDKEKLAVERMCGVITHASKPVLIYSYSGYKQSSLTYLLSKNGIHFFLDHHDAAGAMAVLARVHEIQSRMDGRRFEGMPPVTEPASDSSESLLEPEAKKLLHTYDIPFPQEAMARNAAEAVAAAEAIGYPVVLKIVSKDILHKSEAGGVLLGLKSAADVEKAYQTILDRAGRYRPGAEIAGVLVCRMETGDGVEIIIGGMRDPVFGPVLMFGLGGIFVEVLKDVSFRVCPIDETDAEEMISEIKGSAVLQGARGTAPVDMAALKHALQAVSRLLIEHPGITEIDLNPIKVKPDGLSVLDARILGTLNPHTPKNA